MGALTEDEVKRLVRLAALGVAVEAYRKDLEQHVPHTLRLLDSMGVDIAANSHLISEEIPALHTDVIDMCKAEIDKRKSKRGS